MKITKQQKGENWLDGLWSSDKELQQFADEEDPGFEFIVKVELRMEDLELSRSDLARRLERSPAYVTQVLSQGRNLTIKSMVRLAQALKCKIRVDLEPCDSVFEIPSPVEVADAWGGVIRHSCENVFAMRSLGTSPDVSGERMAKVMPHNTNTEVRCNETWSLAADA